MPKKETFRMVAIYCLALIFPCAVAQLQSSLVWENPSQGESDNRLKRSPLSDDRNRACEILIGIDEPLFEEYNNNLTSVVDLAQKHVDALNDIFITQVFTSGSDTDRYFHLARVQVMFGSCDGFEIDNCTEHREQYLKAFDSLHDFSDFCLAYMFTHRDFHNDTAGLANIGTVCRKRHNSGFITFLNNGLDADFDQSSLTFAHEVGHNFGATHDENATNNEDCKDKGYIMSGVSTNDGNVNRRNFSSCSLVSIRQGLKNLTDQIDGAIDCFQSKTKLKAEVEISFCGNGIVEPGESCDCGSDEFSCNDDCCYPAHISVRDRNANKTAVFCQTNEKSTCINPRPIIFAIYLPIAFIILVSISLFFVLRHDWKGQKKFFTHITDGQVRIVRPNA